MTAPLRLAAKLFLVLQIPFAFACSDAGPGGPGDPAGSRFAGLFTLSDEPGTAASGPAFRGPDALAGARVELTAGGETVTSFQTGPTGAFSSTLPAGAYTVRLAMTEGPPLEFALDLPPRATLFAEGRVDRSTSGAYTLNVQVFRDGNADAQPDDAFRMQILDRVQGDEESGFEDVVATAEEAEAAVTLCHVPPGNPDAAHTVTVGASAVPAHLAHGDVEGVCEEIEPPADEGEDGEGETEDDGEVKVLVCHVPPGNPENPHTIEVGESAVPAHLAHGDTEGACEGDTEPGDDSEGEDDVEDEGEVKVLVCHVPPGNPENPHTLEVGESAVPAHLAHGDTEGACAEETPPAEGEEGEDGGGEG
ncbi:MAG TPA: carboxypeptidase-like regulatory domain-containing protein [Gemmatimonadota bacterium]|nr:carboxypeptidase-like regulatory domain-containing protein [Gemmatimonadota bacterium]